MTDSPIVTAVGISRQFPGAPTPTLLDVNLSVAKGERIVILGASGTGKSTLLHILGGLEKPTSGSVLLMGEDLTACDENRLSAIRNRQVGFVFQLYRLMPEFTALENVMMPLLLAGAGRSSAAQAAEEALDKVGLSALARRRPDRMSGGEQQRVAIARALINNAPLILADEPTGNLDEESGAAVIDLLWRRTEDEQRAIVLVTHERQIALKADRTLWLDHGILVEAPGGRK